MEYRDTSVTRERAGAKNRHRRDVISSKMKAERLKIALQKLRDGERHSKLRNESLLQDFDKVTKMGADLDIKAEKLKKVKRDYETYINSIYPEWKENLQGSRIPSVEAPDERRLEKVSQDHQFSNSPEFRDDHTHDFHSTLKSDVYDQRKDYGTNRSPIDVLRDSRRPQRSPRDSINYSSDQNYRTYSSRFDNGRWHDSHEIPWQHEYGRLNPELHTTRYRERSPTEREPVWQDRRRVIDAPSAMPTYRGHHGDDYNVNSRSHCDSRTRHSPRNTFVDSYNPFYDTHQRRSEVRPQSLNISSLDKSADITDFTILPQALAMSPDGRLILLPMAVSPGRHVAGDETFRQTAAIRSDVQHQSIRRNEEDMNWKLEDELDRKRSDYASESKLNSDVSSEKLSGLNRNGISSDHAKDFIDGPLNSRSRREIQDRLAEGKPQHRADASNQCMKHPTKEQQQDRRYSAEEIVPSRESLSLSMRDRLQLHGLDALKVDPHTETETMELEGSVNNFHDHRIVDVEAGPVEKLERDTQVGRNDRSGLSGKSEQRDGTIQRNEVNNSDFSGSVSGQEPSNTDLHDSVVLKSQDLTLTTEILVETAKIDKKGERIDEICPTERTDSGRLADRKGGESMEHKYPQEGLNSKDDLARKRITNPSVDSFEIAEPHERKALQPPKFEHNPSPEPVSAPVARSLSEDVSDNCVVSGKSSIDMSQSQPHSIVQLSEHIENAHEKGDVHKAPEEHLDPVPDLRIPTKQQSEVKVSVKKQPFLEMPALSYLFEEIENRMGTIDRKEFYRAPVDSVAEDVLEKIRRIATIEGNMEKFETRDLCIVSKLEIPAFVIRYGNGSVVAGGNDAQNVYSLDNFRNIISPAFEELWEYIFNHMELLVGNLIFESATVAEIFSHLLCPRDSDEAYEVSQALLRVIDGGEEYYDDDEQNGYEMDSQINDDAASERSDQDRAKVNDADVEPRITPASPSKESYQSRVDQSDKTSTKEAATVKHQESKQSKAPKGTPTKQINNSKTKDMDDLSLDLGSVSEDDDSSTFDSTKLTPHREKTNNSNDTLDAENQDNSQSLGDDDITDPELELEDNHNELSTDDVAPKSQEPKKSPVKKPEAKGDAKKEQISEVYDSDDDLDDLLNSSLVLSGRSTKNAQVEEETSGYQPSTGKQAERRNRPIFNSKQDSFEIDEIKPNKNNSTSTTKNDAFSPDNSRSIASKFRKPGFWENSDSESEAENLNISGGNNLSSKQEDDEFDFDFYN